VQEENFVVSREEVETALSRILLERVHADKYPSATHMQLLEQTLTPALARDYLNVLLEKLLQDKYPSIPTLHRVRRIAAML
jgi:hypothetical protein